MLKNIINRGILRILFSTQTKAIQAPKKFSQSYTKARPVMSLYSLTPKFFTQNFVAPNATVVGQVFIGTRVVIGHGAVVRGDINSIYIHKNTIIGDNCVLHTAPALPTGLPAILHIQPNTVVSAGCTLYSCRIGRGAYIGSNTVILEGAVIQDGAIILPNSVVPPGRVVPANQVWGGNPIKFIRFAQQQQKFVTKQYAVAINEVLQQYKQQFLGHNNAYLYKPSNEENDSIRSHHLIKPVDDIDTDGNYNPNNSTF